MSSTVEQVAATLSALPQELLDLIHEFAISADPQPRRRQSERINHTAVCQRWRRTRGVLSFKELVISTEDQISGFVESLRGIEEDTLAVTGIFLELKLEGTYDVTKEIQYILEKSTNATEIQLSLTTKMQRRSMDTTRLVNGLRGLVKLKSVKFLGGMYFDDDFLSILSLWPRLQHLDLTGLSLPLEIPPFISPSLVSLTIATDEATDLLTLLHSSTTTLTHLSLELALYAYSTEEIDNLELSLKACTKLVDLRYCEAPDRRSQLFMESILSSLPLLQTLTISSMHFPRPSKFLPYLPLLHTLSVWQPRESLAFVAQLADWLETNPEGGCGGLKEVEILNYHPELHRFPVDIERVCREVGLGYKIEKDFRSLV